MSSRRRRISLSTSGRLLFAVPIGLHTAASDLMAFAILEAFPEDSLGKCRDWFDGRAERSCTLPPGVRNRPMNIRCGVVAEALATCLLSALASAQQPGPHFRAERSVRAILGTQCRARGG